MDVYEAISRRMTIREFEDREIPAEIIRKLLVAGLQAPTNDHLRQWEFILVQDMATRERLISLINSSRTKSDAETLVNQWGMTDSSQRDMYLDAIPKQYAMLFRAGCLMIPCFRPTGELLQPETLSSLNSFASIWCCIENILIAAAAEGIFGVTRIPAEREREHLRRVLNIPEAYEVPCYLALGYPAPTAKRLKQHEINIEEKIHLNAW
ncbi:nitroreductase family protein [Candidatus Moduliflexus flocculans]|uniref:Nitroreductase family protein n=1 Tax=Candidatus Moduliflexus flocculans TaxID=1499966 RepID=A0A081BPC4_9BACT|nr:nitroreductase family protein [Candidatus Moduliflexus flocculans]